MPPVDVRLGFPDVLAPAGEPESLESHGLQGAVAGQDHEVGPRNLLAVLLFDGPEQPARLVEVRVVGPAVERGEALGTRSCAAAAVSGAVGASAVPRHPDEERPVVTVVGRPPVLGVRHQREEVLLHGLEVEFLELLRVVELLPHGIGWGRVLVEDPEVQLIGPPVPVRRAPGLRVNRSPVIDRALAFVSDSVFVHESFRFWLV